MYIKSKQNLALISKSFAFSSSLEIAEFSFSICSFKMSVSFSLDK